MKTIIKSILLLTLVLFITSCVNLKAINDYAKSSKETVQAFNEADISLVDSYKHIKMHECIQVNVDTPGFFPYEKTCYKDQDLQLYKKSDSLVSIVNTTLEKYFSALEELSDNQSSSFELKSETISQILSDENIFNVSEEKIKASKNLVKILTNAATNTYRKKQLALIIAEVHEQDDLKEVVEMNKKILQRIVKNFKNNNKANKNLYKKLYNRTNNIANKFSLAENYLKETSSWSARIELLIKYMKSLEEIIKGHEELYRKGKNLDTKDIIPNIAEYITNIVEIKNEIKKLKSHE